MNALLAYAYYFSRQCKKSLFEPPVLITRGKIGMKKLIVEQLVPSNVGIQEKNA